MQCQSRFRISLPLNSDWDTKTVYHFPGNPVNLNEYGFLFYRVPYGTRSAANLHFINERKIVCLNMKRNNRLYWKQ